MDSEMLFTFNLLCWF